MTEAFIVRISFPWLFFWMSASFLQARGTGNGTAGDALCGFWRFGAIPLSMPVRDQRPAF
jgi:hypothetical protein